MRIWYSDNGRQHIEYDSLDDISMFCKEHNMTYAEYQKNETMIMLGMKHGKAELVK
jgi:hypothetical protein